MCEDSEKGQMGDSLPQPLIAILHPEPPPLLRRVSRPAWQRWRRMLLLAAEGAAAALGVRTGCTSRATPLTSWSSSTTSALSPWSCMGSMPRRWRHCPAPLGLRRSHRRSHRHRSMTTLPRPLLSPRLRPLRRQRRHPPPRRPPKPRRLSRPCRPPLERPRPRSSTLLSLPRSGAS